MPDAANDPGPQPRARPLVVIADCNFPSTATERRVLAALDAEVVVGQCATEEQVIELCADAEGIILQYAPLTRRVIGALRRCRVISRYGIGVDTIDVAAATERGIWVGNVPGFCTVEVAEHTLAQVLALARRLFPLDRLVHAGGWSTIDVMGSASRLQDQTLGLIGFGNIGRAVAVRASALGLRVLAYSPRTTAAVAAEHHAEAVSLSELLARSDCVSLHCPLTPATRQILDAAALRRLKPGAFVVNTSRGALIDQPALVAALQAGHLGGAALDVLATEPIPPGDPLLTMRNVILTPHSAFYSTHALDDLQTRVAQNVVAVLQGARGGARGEGGGRPLSAVNDLAGLG